MHQTAVPNRLFIRPQCGASTLGEEGSWYLKDSELLVRMEAWRSEATVRQHTMLLPEMICVWFLGLILCVYVWQRSTFL